jgi:hypothetical protein
MSKSYELVPFAHGSIPTIEENGEINIIMPTVAASIGLDWEPQRKRIERHPVLAGTTSIMEVVTSTGIKPTTVMTLEGFHAFLLTLHPDRVKDEAVRERIIAYQRTAFRVVFEHFHGPIRIARAKPMSVLEFGRTVEQLEKQRNPQARAALYAHLDQITDSWGIARVVRAIGYADPDYTDVLADFWAAIRGLEEAGIEVNQSRRNTVLALHMPKIRQIFADAGITISIDRPFTDVLRKSTAPRFIDYKVVNCRDGKARQCWVFGVLEIDSQ